jgi:S-adenosylmethionine-diacylglycerol 3-amino-3-carboxypropyl transferase
MAFGQPKTLQAMQEQDKIHQIQLQKLLFTQNWEDPISDHKALRIQSGEVLLTITSGGCNTLGFLLRNPQSIYSVDINGSQNWQMELKMAAIRKLDSTGFLQFLGVKDVQNRVLVYEKLRPELSAEAQIFWDAKKDIIAKGFLGQGRFEKFVKMVGALIRFLQGHKKVEQLFAEKDLSAQQKFYDNSWDTLQMRLLFRTLFNKYILARRGLNADYFHFDDGSSSFSQSFYYRLKKALREIPIKGNYFLSVYLLGKYRNEEEMPEYLLPKNFEAIRLGLTRINLITKDAQSWLESLPDESIDCFALSNICELMSLEETERMFRQIYRTSRKGGRVIFRNLMIPREVPDSMSALIVKDEELSKELLATDRSFVYSKVAAYIVNK